MVDLALMSRIRMNTETLAEIKERKTPTAITPIASKIIPGMILDAMGVIAVGVFLSFISASVSVFILIRDINAKSTMSDLRVYAGAALVVYALIWIVLL